MNVSFNRDHLTFKFSVNPESYEEDLLLGIRLQKMMESEEWQLLIGEWIKADQMYRDAIMKVGMTDADSRLVGKKAAAYNGFNEAVSLCKKFVDACNDYRQTRIKEIDKALRAEPADVDVPTYD